MREEEKVNRYNYYYIVIKKKERKKVIYNFVCDGEEENEEESPQKKYLLEIFNYIRFVVVVVCDGMNEKLNNFNNNYKRNDLRITTKNPKLKLKHFK